MRRYGMGMRSISVVTLAAFVAGCTTVLPERFATPDEVFPKVTVKPSSPDIPPDSKKSVQFEAPFEDVWRAVTIGVTQAQLNIESSQKASGILFATRLDNKNRGAFNKKNVYTYAVMVKETGPKATEVTAFAKVQGDCTYTTPIGIILEIITILPIGIGLMNLFAINPLCEEISAVQWAESGQELNQIVIFTRNNLIAAGAL